MAATRTQQDNIRQNVFQDIRDGFLYVAENAAHVRICHDKIEDYAKLLPAQPPANVFDDTHHYIGDVEATAAYVLTLDSVNFGSGYEPDMVAEGWQRIDNSIYYSLSTRLKSFYERDGVISAARLADYESENCLSLFELNPEGPYSREFADLCAMSMRELGETVQGTYNGSFAAMVKAADGSAEKMVGMLSRMHHFNDVHSYKGRKVPFYKRAQITAADLHLAYGRLGEKLFKDIHQFTMFPDNAVPNVLRLDGIIEYTPELMAKIEAEEEIPSGSEEEVEIRACAGHVVELLAAAKNTIPMHIDHILWHRSVENARYKESKSHRTRSLYY